MRHCSYVGHKYGVLRDKRGRNGTQNASPVALLEALWKNKLDILQKSLCGYAAFTIADYAS